MPVLRGEFKMGLVDIDGIKPIVQTGKVLSNLTRQANPYEDGWARFERILSGINQLVENYQTMRNEAQSPAGAGRNYLTDDGLGERKDWGKPNKQIIEGKAIPKSEVNPMPEITAKLISFFEGHLTEMAKDDANMSIADAIAKIPLNVTQALALIKMIKLAGVKGGKDDRLDG